MNRCWQSEQCKGNYKEKERKENQGECEEKLEEQQDYENSKEYTDPYTPEGGYGVVYSLGRIRSRILPSSWSASIAALLVY